MRTLVVACLLTACASRPAAPVVRNPDSTAAVASADERWALRLDPDEARAALAAWEEAAVADPADPTLHLAVTRACHFLAEAHRVSDRVALLERGVAAAERGLRASSSDFDRLRRLDAPFEDAIAALDRDAAPLLYWWAVQRMAVAREEGFAATVAAHPVVWSAMERVEALDPDTWYRGADRYFAAAYAVMPPVAGGDLARSRERFESALAHAPDFLETRLLYAALYATAAEDDALYRVQLTAIVEAPAGDPAIEPEQELVRRRARELLGATP
jgi:hypothetical protein